MTIELSLLIAGLSLAFAVYQGISNMKRNKRTDDREEAAQMTTVIVKLENINTGVTEIKAEIRNLKTDIQELRDRLIIVEQSTKSAHHRIDGMEGKNKVEGS